MEIDFKMKGCSAWGDYESRYNEHIEEITRLQMLLNIEEQKLFELIKIKRQIINTEGRLRIQHKLIDATDPFLLS